MAEEPVICGTDGNVTAHGALRSSTLIYWLESDARKLPKQASHQPPINFHETCHGVRLGGASIVIGREPEHQVGIGHVDHFERTHNRALPHADSCPSNKGITWPP